MEYNDIDDMWYCEICFATIDDDLIFKKGTYEFIEVCPYCGSIWADKK